MVEGEQKPELIEFEANYQQGLEEFMEVLEEFGDEPLSPDPFSLGLEDQRTFEELSPAELVIVQRNLYKTFGINPLDPTQEIRSYQTDDSRFPEREERINVTVLKTNREEQGIVLQEMRWRDGAVRWMVGPDQDI